MLAFSVEFKPGIPIYEQVTFAVKKAIGQGVLKPGERFPSVREMSKELKINPNTAQKIVSQLVREKLLMIEPGRGSIVSALSKASEEQFKEVIKPHIEQVVVEAKRMSISKKNIIKAIQAQWDIEGGE